MKKGDPIAFVDFRGERRLGYFGEESYLGLVWVSAKKGGQGGWWVRKEQIVSASWSNDATLPRAD